jgi:hypothetical protein
MMSMRGGIEPRRLRKTALRLLAAVVLIFGGFKILAVLVALLWPILVFVFVGAFLTKRMRL